MIPRGLYGAAIPAAAPPPSGPTFLQAATTPSGTVTTHTFPSQNLGPAAAGRVILVAAAAQALITAITVGGVSATNDILHTGGSSLRASVWRAAVPTGSTGNVVVTFSSTSNRCGIGLWRAESALTVVGTGTGTTLGISVTAGNFLLAAYFGTANPVNWTGGVTERFELPSPDLRHSGADVLAASTGTITPSPSGGTFAACSVAYSF